MVFRLLGDAAPVPDRCSVLRWVVADGPGPQVRVGWCGAAVVDADGMSVARAERW